MSDPAADSPKPNAPAQQKTSSPTRIVPLIAVLAITVIVVAWYFVSQRMQLAAEEAARDDLKSVRAMISLDSEQKHVSSLAMALPGVREQAAEHAASIAKLTHLVHLDLSDTNFTDEQLKQLHGLKRLKSIVLNRTRVTDEGLKEIAQLPIETLNLRATDITPAGLETIGQMETLQVLDLSETQAIENLSPLTDLDKLTWLVLSNVELSDQAIETVMQVPNLARLTMIGSQVSEASLKRLRDEKPTLDVQLAPTISVPESSDGGE